MGRYLAWLVCSFSNLPSPSSTTAWITMGNTPRSRSKFSFKGRGTNISQISFYAYFNKSKSLLIHDSDLCKRWADLPTKNQHRWRLFVYVVMCESVTNWAGCCRYSHLPLSTRWNLFWTMAWRTAGSPLACNAQFQRPVMDSLGCTCTQHVNESNCQGAGRNTDLWYLISRLYLRGKMFLYSCFVQIFSKKERLDIVRYLMYSLVSLD